MKQDLKEFLSNKYSTHDFEDFIRERFYGLEIQDSGYTDDDLSDNEKLSISEYRYLGKSELDDGKEIGFFEFRSLKSNIENKRVGYNTILKKLAKEHIFDGAIASFSHANSDVWRLSFVGLNYEDGKAEPTNLKRYTYVLGEGVSGKTAYEQLKDLKYPSFNEIEESFAVEKVSKEFFTKYKKLYFDTLEELRPQIAIFGSDQALELFTKKLMGRITFLYFLQKKGWLGAKESWEDGNKRFLTQCFEGKYKAYENFYDDILKTIFFEALNIDRSENADIFAPFGKMPYLNGGLFSKKDADNDERLLIENTLFENIITTFDQYNFTIIEDTPHESEVAIDPEMLGKVFEDLLEDRKDKGAFYTPREIVHYMCQQSLENYLKTKPKEETDLDYIKKIKILDPAIGSGAFPMGMLHEILEKRMALGDTQSLSSMKRDIIENSIYGIDIEPSAVEIAKLRFWLSIVVDEATPTPLPNLFYKIMVGNSLLETINGFDPLAKDASSLFDKDEVLIDEIQELLHRFYYTHINKKELQEEIDAKIDEILNKKLDKHQDELRSQVNNVSILGFDKKQTELVQKLTENIALTTRIKQRPTTDLFFYKVYFADVMNRGGFDVVIGNPPYVRHEKIKDLKPKLQAEGYKSYSGTADLYIYFFEQGYRLLKENGILSYITSNTYVNARYAEKFREFIVNNVNVLSYVDFSKVQLFDSETVATSIFVLNKNSHKSKYFQYCDTKGYKKGKDLEKFVTKNNFDYLQDDLRKEGFIFTSRQELEIKKVIDKKGKKLKSADWDIQIKSGIKTGFNEAFIIDEEKKNELIEKDSKNTEIIKPLLRGRDVKKYEYEFANKWLIVVEYEANIYLEKEYPEIYNHLESYKTQLSKRGQCTNRGGKGQHHWLELDNNPSDNYFELMQSEKVIWLELSDNSKFAFDAKNYYLDMTVFFMTGEDLKYLLALLNSKLIYWYFNLICAESGVGTNRWKKIYVEQLPIKKISKEAQKPFETLVDYVIFAKENNLNLEASLFESVIDGLVYDLYFEEEMKKGDCFISDEVSKVLGEFDSAKIGEVYKIFKNNKTIQRGLIYRRVISVVKVINGGDK